jgi:hypothetical protein
MTMIHRKMKVYNCYSQEYLCDPDYYKVVDGIEYIIDICGTSEDQDNHHNLLQDFITYRFIPRENAVIVNNRVYNVSIIYDWIKKQKQDGNDVIVDMLRIPITQSELQTVIEKYEQVCNTQVDQYNQVNFVEHTCELPEPRIEFSDDIARGDVFLYRNGHYAYSASWYQKKLKYTFIYGTDDVTNLSVQSYLINVNEIIGYVKKNHPMYNKYITRQV